MLLLVVEKNMGAKGLEERCLVPEAHEMCFVSGGPPRTQRPNNPFVRGCISRRHQSDPHSADIISIQVNSTQFGQFVQEVTKWTARQRITGVSRLVFQESLEALFVMDFVGLRSEHDRVAVECNS